ncbi:hypothetical protein T492DRAFT_938105 [Pavlovales sp. CCMP2436]|nr:hypothetical protein T492DRAFT_938105 [Pavlovales sp. CCMP2436]
MDWPQVHVPPPLGGLACVSDEWSIAPVTLTHLALVLGVMFVYCERAQLRKACIVGSAYSFIMLWFVYRRLTAGFRRRSQVATAAKPKRLPSY